MLGLGILASVGWAKEVTYGTGVGPAGYWPIVSESISAPRESIDSNALVGQREIGNTALGIKKLSGGIVVENDGSTLGQPLKFWNGPDGYSAVNLNTLSMWITAAPTGVASAGGTVPVGAYRYYVCLVVKRVGMDEFNIIMPPSAESATISSASSNNTLTLTFTDITTLTPPLGMTVQGVAVYRTPVGGSTGTETFYAYQPVGTSPTTFVDNGTAASQDANVVPPISVPTLYRHRYLGTPPSPGVEPLDSFTLTVNKDNDFAEQYAGCRMGEFKIGASGGNTPLNVNFSLMGQNVTTVANTTPTFTALEQMLGWKVAAFVDSSSSATYIEGFDLSCTNNLAEVPGFKATPYNRDVAAGFRKISGNIKRNNDDHTFWNKVQRGTEFGLKMNFYGQSVVATGSNLYEETHGITAIPFPFFMEIELFRCRTPKVDNPVGGPGRIVETVDFHCFRSSTYATAMRINLYNTTSLYT